MAHVQEITLLCGVLGGGVASREPAYVEHGKCFLFWSFPDVEIVLQAANYGQCRESIPNFPFLLTYTLLLART